MPKILFGVVLAVPFFSVAASERVFGLGQAASLEEISGWDIDVRPDGLGAPVGSGTARAGEGVYGDLCAHCHGDFGEGVDRWPVLAGGLGSLSGDDPVKTVGSYWPYASTVYDYIYRAMPFGEAQSLTADETYMVVAYLLYMSDIIADDFEVSHETIGLIEMPNRGGFLLPDPRPDAQAGGGFLWGLGGNFLGNFLSWGACMSDCAVSTEIIGRARIIDVTPEKDG